MLSRVEISRFLHHGLPRDSHLTFFKGFFKVIKKIRIFGSTVGLEVPNELQYLLSNLPVTKEFPSFYNATMLLSSDFCKEAGTMFPILPYISVFEMNQYRRLNSRQNGWEWEVRPIFHVFNTYVPF